jgi:F0F1-type ATP synthase membrane subunit a
MPFINASRKAKITLKLSVKTSSIEIPVEILDSVYINLITEIGDILSEIVPITIPKRLMGNIIAAEIIVTKYGNPSS